MTELASAPLSTEISRSVRSSATPLLERRGQFTSDFHLRLRELLPEVPVMHEPAGEQVTESLVNCVLWAVFATEPTSVVGLTLQGVGLEVHRAGFPISGYQAVGHALLRSLRDMYPMDWSGSMSSAWIGYHSWLCEHWLRGAEMGRSEDERIRAAAPPPPEPEPAADEDDLDEEEGLSYNEIMVSMTLGGRPARRRDEGLRHRSDER